MTLAVIVAAAWLLLSLPFGMLVGRSIRLADDGGPRPLPARLSPRAELPHPDRVLLLVAVAGGLLVAFATRGQVVTWDGFVAVPS